MSCSNPINRWSQTVPVLFIVHGQVLAQWPQMFRILNMFGTYFF